MNEGNCPLCGNQYDDPLYLGKDNNPYHRCPPRCLPASDKRSHKWYTPHPLQNFFRKRYLDEDITAPGKKQCIECTNRIELRFSKDGNGKKKRGYAYGINRAYWINRDSVWSWDDTIQECYRAFFEGYNIICSVKRVLQKESAIRKVKRPPGGRNRTVEDPGEAEDRQQYPVRQYRRANPWIIVGGNKIYFADIKKQKRWIDEEQVYDWSKGTRREGNIYRKEHKYNKVEGQLILGEEIHEVAEEKYALPNVDRPLLEEEAIKTGGEVVTWRARRREKEGFEDEATLTLKEATEECFCKVREDEHSEDGSKEDVCREDGYSFDGAGYYWDNYHGYCLDI